MKYNYYVNDDGYNIIEIPELNGKNVELSEMISLFELIGYPSITEDDLEEYEIEEYIEENECEREEAIENLIEQKETELYEDAPSLSIEAITNDDSLFSYFEVIIENGYDKYSSYEELDDSTLKIVLEFIKKKIVVK